MADPNLGILNADPTVIAGRYIRVTLMGSVLNQQTVNHFFYAATAALNLDRTIMIAFATEFINAVMGPLVDCLNQGWNATELRFYDHQDDSFMPVVYTQAEIVPSTGVKLGECMPPFCSFQLRRQTGVNGRKGRGYVRLSGVDEVSQQSGRPTAGSLIELGALGDALELDLTVLEGGAVMRDWAPFLFSPWVGVGELARRGAPVLDWRTSPELHTQRSRRYGRGS